MIFYCPCVYCNVCDIEMIDAVGKIYMYHTIPITVDIRLLQLGLYIICISKNG